MCLVTDEGFVTHDENLVAHDENFVAHDENLVTHHENLVTHDENFVAHDENLVTHHENFVAHDENFVAHDENLVTHHENLVTHHENLVTHDETLVMTESFGAVIPEFDATAPRRRGSVLSGNRDGLSSKNDFVVYSRVLVDNDLILAHSIAGMPGNPDLGADEYEAMGQFLRHSINAARNRAGTEALLTYNNAKRMARSQRYAGLAVYVADMRRLLGKGRGKLTAQQLEQRAEALAAKAKALRDKELAPKQLQ